MRDWLLRIALKLNGLTLNDLDFDDDKETIPLDDIFPRIVIDPGTKLDTDEEDRFVELILQKKASRELLEKILAWKVGILTREAMASADDKETYGLKIAAKKVAELTWDFKRLWERSKVRSAALEQATRIAPPMPKD